VPWRISPEVARSDLDWMRSWARRPDAPPDIVLADWSWLPGWIAGLRQEPVYPTVLWLAGIALLLVVARMLLPRRLVAVRDLLPPAARLDMVALAAVALAGLAFWFVTAPLVRYGQIWLVLPLLLAIAQAAPVGWGGASALRFAAGVASPRGRTGLAVGASLAVLASLAGRPFSRLLDANPVRFPEIAVEARGNLSGIPVHVPRVGAQCWDAPRLCTPHLREGLVATRFLRGWMVRDRP
jgi:hypothetical protein